MMKLTLIHPAIGKIPGEKYLRAWQMEPLPVAMIAALIPDDFTISFWDDRMEDIPWDEPADLVLMSVETCTAKRAYQIATEYRRRNVPVIMGGFHATLCPEEVMEYADTIVVGEAETILDEVLEDFRKGSLKNRYEGPDCQFDREIMPDRSIYAGKNYLKISLLESGRGCRFRCEFCSIHNFFRGKHHFRPVDTIIQEVLELKKLKRLLFFVDDNIVADQEYASELFKALIPHKLKWVGQADITIAKNPELLKLMSRSGCQGVLIGFENLRPENLKEMKKGLFRDIEELGQAIRTIHRNGLRIYGTFLFGYDHDKPEDFDLVLKFCIRNKLFMVGFNHLTPFPGTQLYERLKKEKKLLYPEWWLEDSYTYGQIPFQSTIPYDTIEEECRRIRYRFYGFRSMLFRMTNRTNINSWLMFPMYLTINTMLRKDTLQRKKFPLGDLAFRGQLLKVKRS
ncbi:MAG: B12-binding domain-containing radical SAM protein [Bacteroidales bacterium]|nr:B12-binding domain-containing radical SAM protein [Bacteroidales bacterium]